MAVGAIEQQFYHELLKGLKLDPEKIDHISDFEENKRIIAAKFKEKTQEEWCNVSGF